MTIAAEREGIQYHVLMVSFEGRKTASEIVDRLKGEGAFRECEVEAEAFVWRDEDGKVHLHERGGAGAGAAFGATAMGIVSILGGPLVVPLMMIAGGVAGGVAGHLIGKIIPEDDLRRVGDSLQPGSSAYIAIVDHAHANVCARAFDSEAKSILNVPVETELSNVIREGIAGEIVRV